MRRERRWLGRTCQARLVTEPAISGLACMAVFMPFATPFASVALVLTFSVLMLTVLVFVVGPCRFAKLDDGEADCSKRCMATYFCVSPGAKLSHWAPCAATSFLRLPGPQL